MVVLKRSLLLLGLIVSISARPAVEDSGNLPLDSYDATKCALACKGRQLWKGYETGKVFEYNFNHSTTLRNYKVDDNGAWMSISGKAFIAVASPCEMVLKVKVDKQMASSFKSWDETNRESPRRVFESIESKPLRFSFNDGQIKNLCPMAGEERASLNLKRAILSSFQVSVPNSNAAASVTERDIMGDCPTEYAPVSPKKISKTKNLRSCKGRDRFYSPLQGQRYTSNEGINALPLLKSTFKCDLDFKQQGSSDILNEANCVEQHLFKPFSRGEAGAKVYVSSKLTFVSAKSAEQSLSGAIAERTSLPYAHRTGKHCHNKAVWSSEISDSTECLERGELGASDTYVKKAKSVLKSMCSLLSQDIRPDVPKQFMQLVKHLRGIEKVADLQELHAYVKQADFCSGSTPQSKTLVNQFFHDALPILGTETSVKVMTKFLEMSSSDVSAADRTSWLASLVFIRHPTRQMVVDLKPLLKSSVPDYSQVVLSMSSLIYRLCQTDAKCLEDAGVKQVVALISEPLGSDCKSGNAQQRNKILIALRAIGNMGRTTKDFETLNRCMLNEKVDMEVRVSAAQALRRVPCSASGYPINSFAVVAGELKYDPELRINAYLSLMRCAMHNESIVSILMKILHKEKSQQVGSFIYTHLTNLAESSNEFKKDLRFLLKDYKITKKFQLDARSFSRNIDKSFFSEAMNSGANFDSNIIFSHESFVPRSINANLTLDVFGRSMNFLEVGARFQGVEDLVESYMTKKAPSASDASAATARDAFVSADQHKFAKAKEMPRGSMYYRVFGNEINYVSMKDQLMQKMKSWSMGRVLQSLAQEQSIDQAKSNVFLESVVSMPTVSGFPLLLKIEGISSTYMKIAGKADLTGFSAGVINVNGRVAPSAAVRVVGTMAIDGFFSKTGMRLVADAHTSTAMSGTVAVNMASKEFELQMAPSKDKQDVLTFKTNVHYFHHGENKKRITEDITPSAGLVESSKCTNDAWKKAFGFELCLNMKYYKPATSTPLFPFNGPGLAQITWNKKDTHSAYKMSAKMKKNGLDVDVLFNLDTPGSAVKRQFLLKVKSKMTAAQSTVEAAIKTPWRQALLTAKMSNEGQQGKAELTLLVDETTKYAIKGSLASTRKVTAVMNSNVVQGNFKLELPGQTEQPKLTYLRKIVLAKGAVQMLSKITLKNLKVGGVVREYSFEMEGNQSPTVTIAELKLNSQSNKFHFLVSKTVKKVPRPSYLTRLMVSLSQDENTPKSRFTKLSNVFRILKTGPFDYTINGNQRVIKKANNVLVEGRHPLDLAVTGKVQLRSNTWKRVVGDGSLSYTSPQDNKFAKLELADVILGWHKNAVRAKGAAQATVTWLAKNAVSKSKHHIRYERSQDWKLLDFSVLNEIKNGGRKDAIKIYHKMEKSSPKGLAVDQEASVKISGRVEASLVHKIGKKTVSAPYKQDIKLRYVSGKVSRDVKYNSVYIQRKGVHTVTATGRYNSAKICDLNLTVKPAMNQGADFVVKATGQFKGQKMGFSHKHSYVYKPKKMFQYKLAQTVYTGVKRTIDIGISSEGKMVLTPRFSSKIRFVMTPNQKRSLRYGFKMETSNVKDADYTLATNSVEEIYLGYQTFRKDRKIRFKAGAKQLKMKHSCEHIMKMESKTLHKLEMKSELALDSRDYKYSLQLANKLKGSSLASLLLRQVFRSAPFRTDYQSKYEVEFAPGATRKMKIKAKQNLAGSYFFDGDYESNFRRNSKSKMTAKATLNLKTSFKAIPKLKCESSFSLDRAKSKMSLGAVAKLNDNTVMKLDSNHEINTVWKSLGFKNKVKMSYFGNTLTIVSQNTKRVSGGKINRVGLHTFMFKNAAGKSYSGEAKSKYTFGMQYFDYVKARGTVTYQKSEVLAMTLLHQLKRVVDGIPAEFNGKGTMKIQGYKVPTVVTYVTRHELSGKQILATIDLKTKDSALLLSAKDYQFRTNFEYVRTGYPRRVVFEVLSALGPKQANIKVDYERNPSKIIMNSVIKSDFVKVMNIVYKMNANYGAGFSTFTMGSDLKYNSKVVWDEVLQWDVENLLKVKKIEYKLSTMWEMAKSMQYTYNHDFTAGKRLIQLKGVRNGATRLLVAADFMPASSPTSKKSVVLKFLPGSQPSMWTPHITFDWKHMGIALFDSKHEMTLEIKPFLAPVSTKLELLYPGSGAPRTFRGMAKANMGVSVQATTGMAGFKKMDAFFMTSASPKKMKLEIDVEPIMTGASKLSVEGDLVMTATSVSMSTSGKIMGRTVGVKYNRAISSRNPLTLTSSLKLSADNKDMASYNFNMKGYSDMSLTGKSPWAPLSSWEFQHKAMSLMNFETKLSTMNAENAASKLKIKFSMPASYQQIDGSIDIKTPYNALKVFTVNIMHRHTNPVQMWSDMSDKITFKYKTAAKSYTGEWNLALQTSVTKKFGVKQVYGKFSSGLTLPFTTRREMSMALELTGNINSAKLSTSVKPRAAKIYSFDWEHEVPDWSQYAQQAKILTKVKLPGQTDCGFNVIRSSTLYSVNLTTPYMNFKRFIISYNKPTSKLQIEATSAMFGTMEFNTDLAKLFQQDQSQFTTAFVSIKMPNDLIKVTLTRLAAQSYSVKYTRGPSTTLTANLKYNYDFSSMRKVDVILDVTSTWQIIRQAKIRFLAQSDFQWRSVRHESDVTWNSQQMVKMVGTLKRDPQAKTCEISWTKSGKFFDGTLKYTRNWMTKKAKLTVSIEKIQGMPRRYALITDVDASWLLKEFTMKVDIPTRLFVLRKVSSMDAAAKKQSCDFELALNQRAVDPKEGRIIVNYERSYKIKNQQDYTLVIKLPTRTVRHKLTHLNDQTSEMMWRNIQTQYAFSWDVSNPKKEATAKLQLRQDPKKMMSGVLSLKTLAFKESLVFKADAKKISPEKRTLGLSMSTSTSDGCLLKLTEEKPLKGSKDTIITVEFTGKRNNNPMIQFKAVGDAKRLPKRQILLGFQMTAKAPASVLPMPLSFKWIGLYQPMRRLVLSSTTGASLDFNYKPRPFGAKITMFLSNSRKEAARLTISRNVRKPNLNIQLDRGRGSMVMKMPFVAPYYIPNEARAKINIGLSDANTASILALVGPQNLAKSVSGWTKQTHDLAFFFVGAKLTPESIVKFAAKYRLNNYPKGMSANEVMKMSTNAVYNLRTYFIAKVTSDPVIAQVRKLARASAMCAANCITNNVDTSSIVKFASEMANDYDMQKRYMENFVSKNEMYSSVMASSFRTIQLKTTNFMVMINKQASQIANKVQAVLGGVASAMSQQQSYLDSAVNSMWMVAQKFVSNQGQINNFFTNQRNLINGALDAIQTLVDQMQTVRNSAQQICSQMWTQLQQYVMEKMAQYPAVAKMQQTMYLTKSYINTGKNSVQQFIMENCVGPMMARPDFQQMMTQMSRLRELALQLYYGVKSYGLMDMLPKNVRFDTVLKNHQQAMRHLMAGNIKEAYKSFSKIDLYELSKFELICPLATNAACQAKKWHSSIEGQFYLPVYIRSFRLFGLNVITMVRRRMRSMMWKMKNRSKMYKAINSKMLDTITRVKQVRRVKGIMPPFGASGYIVGSQRFISFDGRHFDHAGTCSRVLTHDFAKHSFSVIANYPTKNESLHMWRSVTVAADGHNIEIFKNGQVKVDGVLKDMPHMVANTKLMAMRTGDRITVDRMMDRSFSVTCFISQQFCRVTLGRWQYNKVGGILGNFDNEVHNDFMLPSRELVTADRVRDFANSWSVGKCADSSVIKTRKNNETPSVCKDLFFDRSSRFARCFGLVPNKPMLSACANEYQRDRSVCQTAAVYVDQCRMSGIILQVPRECISCKSLPKKRSNKRSNLHSLKMAVKKSRDIIFVLEASSCVKKSLKSLKTLSIMLDVGETKFGLVMYGGAGRHWQPHQHTVGQKDFTSDGENFRKTLTQIESNFKATETSSITMGIRALRFAASNYPSRYQAGKSIVLVSCQNSHLGINEYAMAQSYLRERGVAVHVLTAAGTFVQPREDIEVYGVSQKRVYTSKDKSKVGRKGATLGREDLRSSVTAPKDLSTTLALRTEGGAVWNLNKLMESVPKASRRKMLIVLASVVDKSAKAPKCTKCRCRLNADNINSSVDCKLCQQPGAFNFWMGNN